MEFHAPKQKKRNCKLFLCSSVLALVLIVCIYKHQEICIPLVKIKIGNKLILYLLSRIICSVATMRVLFDIFSGYKLQLALGTLDERSVLTRCVGGLYLYNEALL